MSTSIKMLWGGLHHAGLALCTTAGLTVEYVVKQACRVTDDDVLLAKTISERELRDKRYGDKTMFDHAQDVVNRLAGNSCCIIAAGWLHDVIEDTDLSAWDLLKIGIHPRVVRLVLRVTRGEGERYFDFIGRIINGGAAGITVKRADLYANCSCGPSMSLRARYEKALNLINKHKAYMG